MQALRAHIVCALAEKSLLCVSFTSALRDHIKIPFASSSWARFASSLDTLHSPEGTQTQRMLAMQHCTSQPTSFDRVIDSTFLSGSGADQRTSLILLNHTLPPETRTLWEAAHFRVCADGGANRLYDELPKMYPEQDPAEHRRRHLPHVIVGDLDSIRTDVLSFYTDAGVQCVDLGHDQDSTDLQKCLEHIASRRDPAAAGAHTADVLLVLGALGGRLDHTLSNLNALYMYPSIDIALLGEGNMVRLLPKGRSRIALTEERTGQYCGVVPMGASARVTSRGLKWDMDDLKLEWSGMLSTSNQIAAEEVYITCDYPVLWMTTLNHLA